VTSDETHLVTFFSPVYRSVVDAVTETWKDLCSPTKRNRVSSAVAGGAGRRSTFGGRLDDQVIKEAYLGSANRLRASRASAGYQSLQVGRSEVRCRGERSGSAGVDD